MATPLKKVTLRSGQLKRLGRLSAKNPDRAMRVGERMVERKSRLDRGREYLKKNVEKMYPSVPPESAPKQEKPAAKKGAKVVKKSAKKPSMMMKKGGAMKKCRYGCK